MLNSAKIRTQLGKVRKFRDEPLPNGASDFEIDNLTQRTGIPVPADVRAWLRLSNGAWVGPGGVFGIRKSDSFLDIESVLEIYLPWKKKKWIPIAGDGCGNYYVVATQREFGSGFPVLFIDTMESQETPAYLVASDLGHFLEFLLEAELIHDKLRPEFQRLYKIHGNENRLIFAMDDPRLPQWPCNEQYVLARDPDILLFTKELLPWEVDKRIRSK